MGSRNSTRDDKKRANALPAAQGQLTQLEDAAARYEDGDAWDATDVVVDLKPRRPLDKVIPVRLATEQWREISIEAEELGVGPSTLARMWIIERLRELRRQRLTEATRPS